VNPSTLLLIWLIKKLFKLAGMPLRLFQLFGKDCRTAGVSEARNSTLTVLNSTSPTIDFTHMRTKAIWVVRFYSLGPRHTGV
jgi:hypothetical protein